MVEQRAMVRGVVDDDDDVLVKEEQKNTSRLEGQTGADHEE
jgi:predicted RNA-binding protein YlqC (UPF0109 family)